MRWARCSWAVLVLMGGLGCARGTMRLEAPVPLPKAPAPAQAPEAAQAPVPPAHMHRIAVVNLATVERAFPRGLAQPGGLGHPAQAVIRRATIRAQFEAIRAALGVDDTASRLAEDVCIAAETSGLRAAARDEVLAEARSHVERVARRHGYDVVLDRSVLPFASEAPDITDLVLRDHPKLPHRKK